MMSFQQLRAMLVYRKAVIMANRAHAADGGRYYVLPCYSSKIFLVVADRKNFRELQRKHYINNKWKFSELKEKAFYFTANKVGKDGPTDEILRFRQEMYQFWFYSRVAALKEEKRYKRKHRPSLWDRIKNVFAEISLQVSKNQ